MNRIHSRFTGNETCTVVVPHAQSYGSASTFCHPSPRAHAAVAGTTAAATATATTRILLTAITHLSQPICSGIVTRADKPCRSGRWSDRSTQAEPDGQVQAGRGSGRRFTIHVRGRRGPTYRLPCLWSLLRGRAVAASSDPIAISVRYASR